MAYTGKTKGLDGIARSVVWDPRVKKLYDERNLPAFRSLLFRLIRDVLDAQEQDPKPRPRGGGSGASPKC